MRNKDENTAKQHRIQWNILEGILTSPPTALLLEICKLEQMYLWKEERKQKQQKHFKHSLIPSSISPSLSPSSK